MLDRGAPRVRKRHAQHVLFLLKYVLAALGQYTGVLEGRVLDHYMLKDAVAALCLLVGSLVIFSLLEMLLELYLVCIGRSNCVDDYLRFGFRCAILCGLQNLALVIGYLGQLMDAFDCSMLTG